MTAGSLRTTDWRGTPAGRRATTFGRVLVAAGIVGVFLIMARYLRMSLPNYFELTERSYSRHFFEQIPWFIPHLVGGFIAFVVGLPQFIPIIRRRARRLHRALGLLYAGSILVAGLASLILAVNSVGGWLVQLGAAAFGVVWLGTTGTAVWAAFQRRFEMHGRWMFRSYVTTLSFSMVRLGNEVLQKAGVESSELRIVIMIWAGWLVPLMIGEVALRLFFPLRAARRRVPPARAVESGAERVLHA